VTRRGPLSYYAKFCRGKNEPRPVACSLAVDLRGVSRWLAE